jgi:hypothetical protein
VYIPMMSLHRKLHIWTDSSVFNPDKFLAENEANRPSYSLLPSSYGSRNWIVLFC